MLAPPTDELAGGGPDEARQARLRHNLEEACTVPRLRALWIVVGAHPTRGAELQHEVAALARAWQAAGAAGIARRREVVRDVLAWYDRRRDDVHLAITGGA